MEFQIFGSYYLLLSNRILTTESTKFGDTGYFKFLILLVFM